MAWFYILRLKSGGLYVGATGDLERRYCEHRSGAGCRTTALDKPVAIAHSEEYGSVDGAETRERQVKRWSRAKKEALISSDLHVLKHLSRSHEP